MKKEDVVWHEEDEYEVMKDPDGWALVVEINHFKGWMRYDVRTPDNHYLGIFEEDIYKAIDTLNEEKKLELKRRECANPASASVIGTVRAI